MSALETPVHHKDPESAAPVPVESTPLVGKGLAQVNPTRSLIMMACGAVLGLAIAGFGLFTAHTTSNVIPPEDMALVNGQPVLRSDFIAQVEAENGVPFNQTTRAQQLKTLNDMLREELFVQRGQELGMPSSDPDTRAALVAAVEQQVAADVTAQQPTEAQLQAYFEKNRGRYASDGTMTLHELVLPGAADAAALSKAAEAVKALRSGTPVAEVTGRYGMKESGRVSDGEEFYFAAKIHLGDKLFAIARALPSGAVSDPQAAPDGVHVLVMVKNNMPVPQTYADAREKVFFDFKKDEQDRLEKADFNYLKNKSDIRITPEYRELTKAYK